MARNRSEQLIGQPIPPEYLDYIRTKAEDFGTTATKDGVAVQAAYVRSPVGAESS